MNTKNNYLTHLFVWGNNEKRKVHFHRKCRIVATGKKNSCCVEFRDGQREIVSIMSVRRLKYSPHTYIRIAGAPLNGCPFAPGIRHNGGCGQYKECLWCTEG
jgi:hypothetical protein